MKIAIDIDGTLCWSNFPIFLEECNAQFGLGIDQATLATLETKEALYALPEVQRAHVHPDELAWLEYRERCILASLVLDDAPAGVAKLAELDGNLAYYTARYCDIEEIQQEIEKSTHKWLKLYNFINPHKVVYCDQIEGKVLKMLRLAQDDTIILIDDSYQGVIREIERLDKNAYAILRKRLLLVAMRACEDELPSTDLNVVALPSWEDIELEPLLERIRHAGKTKGAIKVT